MGGYGGEEGEEFEGEEREDDFGGETVSVFDFFSPLFWMGGGRSGERSGCGADDFFGCVEFGLIGECWKSSSRRHNHDMRRPRRERGGLGFGYALFSFRSTSAMSRQFRHQWYKGVASYALLDSLRGSCLGVIDCQGPKPWGSVLQDILCFPVGFEAVDILKMDVIQAGALRHLCQDAKRRGT